MGGLVFLALYLLVPLIVVGVVPLLIFYRLRPGAGPGRIPIISGGVAMVVGGFLFAAHMVHLVQQVRSSTGALWLIALPLYTCIAGGVAYAVAWSIATVICAVRKTVYVPPRWQRVLAGLILAVTAVGLGARGYSAYLVVQARDSFVSEDALRAVYRHPWAKRDRMVLLALAENPACPSDVLLDLAQRTDPKLREGQHTFLGLMNNDFAPVQKRVAGNSHTPVAGLLVLARSPSSVVQAEVARNPRTPVAALVELAAVKDFIVLDSLAHNTNTPPEVLERLSAHDNQYVRIGAAQNSGTRSNVLARLSKDASGSVREAVALNPNTPAESLRELSQERSSRIRTFVASNPSTPEDVLRVLAAETDGAIRNYAESNLAGKLKAK